ncbi:S41 family peptidase [Aquibacillus albus]|uniref:Carboxyl-terminal processing protease n=1 Tax=Aquibacillus albus TaxID=1168171 RepID=A0ABS2MW76_9BACI|nr:S41 family peptidase [Aquibacillus albus]MBM7570106.1 carboxyl-terminal processing protease [Aquibacillus albus]
MDYRKKIVSLIAIFIFIFMGIVPTQASTPIDDVRSLVDQYYVDSVSEDVINESTIEEILTHLDQYSDYYSKEEFQAFINTLNNTYVGIGVGIENTDEKIMITQVFPGSSAEAAGVQSNDQIISVDGKAVSGMTLEQVIERVTGQEGTKVEITFYRPSTDTYMKKTLERKNVTLPTILAKKLAGNVGYMRMNKFNDYTIDHMLEELNNYSAVDHWILDVRNNSGGYLHVAQQVVGMFPNANITLIEETKDNLEQLPSIRQEFQFEDQVDLLVNEYSASAAEILAGALQDTNNAFVYGSTTYGKGVMQNIFQLSSGGYLKLTTARFYTPNHRVIDQVGISPDVKTETPLADAHLAWFHTNYSSYKQLNAVENVPTNKVFTVEFSTAINVDSFRDRKIEFIHLGGEQVPVTFSKTENKKIEVTPKEPLIKGEQYLLLIHPGWESTNGKTNAKGTIVKVTVGK